MVAWAIDITILVSVTLMPVFAYSINRRLAFYAVVPGLLTWLHVAGEFMQQESIGPAWVQQHLHNTGAAGYLYPATASLVLTLAGRQYHPGSQRERKALATAFIKVVPIVWGCAVALFITIEIYDVSARGEELRAAGYSGNLDIGDLAAYLSGLAIILANYRIVGRWVLRCPLISP